jgi:transcriptional regulator with XRE-family HTH domain
MTQEQLAERIGAKNSFISRIEMRKAIFSFLLFIDYLNLDWAKRFSEQFVNKHRPGVI